MAGEMTLEQRLKGFPERLKATIGQRSVRSFAAAAGLSEGTLRKYLRNESYPTLDRLVGLVAAGDVSLIWLVTGEGPMHRAEPPLPATGDPGAHRIDELLQLLDRTLAELGRLAGSAAEEGEVSLRGVWSSDSERYLILVGKPGAGR